MSIPKQITIGLIALCLLTIGARAQTALPGWPADAPIYLGARTDRGGLSYAQAAHFIRLALGTAGPHKFTLLRAALTDTTFPDIMPRRLPVWVAAVPGLLDIHPQAIDTGRDGRRIAQRVVAPIADQTLYVAIDATTGQFVEAFNRPARDWWHYLPPGSVPKIAGLYKSCGMVFAAPRWPARTWVTGFLDINPNCDQVVIRYVMFTNPSFGYSGRHADGSEYLIPRYTHWPTWAITTLTLEPYLDQIGPIGYKPPPPQNVLRFSFAPRDATTGEGMDTITTWFSLNGPAAGEEPRGLATSPRG